MVIVLNHTIVPAHNKVAAARFFARIFGLPLNKTSGHFAPVRVNRTLTLLFDEENEFESHHYAFLVSKKEFAAILRRIEEAGIVYEARHGASRTVSSMTGTAAKAFISATRTVTCWS